MATNIPIQAQVGNLPAGFCPTGPDALQQILNAFTQAVIWTMPGTFNGINFGPVRPGPDDTDKPWFRINLDGTPDGLYWYINGQWVRPNPMMPGAIMLWDGALPDFTTFDGGDTNPIGYASGPMWAEVTNAQGRSPIHPGKSDAAHSLTTFLVATKYGDENHPQTVAEMPPHVHFRNPDGFQEGVQTAPAGGQLGNLDSASNSAKLYTSTGSTGGDPNAPPGTSTGQPMSLVHPVYGAYMLRRTARVAYAV